MTTYEPVIGLEVHAQLLTETKAFCACSTKFGQAPNTQTCPTCLGLPGALPVLNGKAVELAVRAALAVGCRIRSVSRFSRKNYFYPDLPKGYQISQFDEPYSENGHLDVSVTKEDGTVETRKVRIQRIHMEEDAGKNLHAVGGDSIVDLNRSGVALIEIVSEPDIRSAKEAAAYLRDLRDILVFLGVNDGNLEEGSFRCDANVSIRPVGTEAFGTRVELKNINSFRYVEKAIEYEIIRQESVLSSGGRIVQETRGYDAENGKSFSLRSKEAAQDYRYFPEPDLPPLLIGDAMVERVRLGSPELPRKKRERFVALGLTDYAAGVLTQHPKIASFFEEAAKGNDAVKVGNFVQAEVLRDTTTRGLEATFPVTAEQVADLVALVSAGTISSKQAKEIYAKMLDASKLGTTKLASALVAELGMTQVTDTGAIEAACQKVIDANQKQAEALRGGKLGLLGFFVGAVMKETKGTANPQIVNDTLKKLLGI
ncbi:MAG: Asp-tRNA(Asn)/Glu-tRNA(Gln) amidotransferase subunit GatB [Polyangiaceae bacterium]|nr:Asp-tRNA(Asn)/Glu-tRNA(Gln) amidotransferase subunit GatB [Polyangiaceae bacterium]